MFWDLILAFHILSVIFYQSMLKSGVLEKILKKHLYCNRILNMTKFHFRFSVDKGEIFQERKQPVKNE